jgi:hypothetical protein
MSEPTQAERAAAWEAGREERMRARQQAIIDRVSPLLAATFERLNAQYNCVNCAVDPDRGMALLDGALAKDILTRAVEFALADAGVAGVSEVRRFILWEPLDHVVGFYLPGFAKRLAERPEWLVAL